MIRVSMKHVLVALLVGIAILGAGCIGGSVDSPAVNKTISVSGQGSVSGDPDQVIVYLGVESNAESAQEARDLNAERMQAVFSALRGLGLGNESIETVEYNMYTVHDYRDGERLVRGYRVTNMIRVNTSNVSMVGRIIDAATTAGANEVQSIEFSIRDTSDLKDRAIQDAIDDARRKAEAAARSLGVSVVGPVSIVVDSQSVQPVRYNAYPTIETTATPAPTPAPISPGSVDISATVHVVYEFQ